MPEDHNLELRHDNMEVRREYTYGVYVKQSSGSILLKTRRNPERPGAGHKPQTRNCTKQALYKWTTAGTSVSRRRVYAILDQRPDTNSRSRSTTRESTYVILRMRNDSQTYDDQNNIFGVSLGAVCCRWSPRKKQRAIKASIQLT